MVNRYSELTAVLPLVDAVAGRVAEDAPSQRILRDFSGLRYTRDWYPDRLHCFRKLLQQERGLLFQIIRRMVFSEEAPDIQHDNALRKAALDTTEWAQEVMLAAPYDRKRHSYTADFFEQRAVGYVEAYLQKIVSCTAAIQMETRVGGPGNENTAHARRN